VKKDYKTGTCSNCRRRNVLVYKNGGAQTCYKCTVEFVRRRGGDTGTAATQAS
jgi:hypothetical protein